MKADIEKIVETGNEEIAYLMREVFENNKKIINIEGKVELEDKQGNSEVIPLEELAGIEYEFRDEFSQISSLKELHEFYQRHPEAAKSSEESFAKLKAGFPIPVGMSSVKDVHEFFAGDEEELKSTLDKYLTINRLIKLKDGLKGEGDLMPAGVFDDRPEVIAMYLAIDPNCVTQDENKIYIEKKENNKKLEIEKDADGRFIELREYELDRQKNKYIVVVERTELEAARGYAEKHIGRLLEDSGDRIIFTDTMHHYLAYDAFKKRPVSGITIDSFADEIVEISPEGTIIGESGDYLRAVKKEHGFDIQDIRHIKMLEAISKIWQGAPGWSIENIKNAYLISCPADDPRSVSAMTSVIIPRTLGQYTLFYSPSAGNSEYMLRYIKNENWKS